MCGIFGIVVRKNHPYVRNYFKKETESFFGRCSVLHRRCEKKYPI